ncbi:MAG TPA: hypothetical protein VKB34_18215, partial [Povalibacter sp.]|nr:hypothetical protein [Povalibacter sp.]
RDFICDRYGQILGAHAPRLMERLYYLKFLELPDIVPTLAVALRNGDSRRVFEFDYGQLLFREAADAHRQCAVGFEIWTSDLELLLGAREEVFMVYESAVRTWSLAPESIDTASLVESFMWFTPRFRPREFLAFYREQIARTKAPAP